MSRNPARYLGMSTKKQLFEYWRLQKDRLGDIKDGWCGFDFDYIGCFACGDTRGGVQRCHIIPVVFGGGNDDENMHLLCARCHVESEGLRDYWKWLAYKRKHEFKHARDHFFSLIEKTGFDYMKEVASIGSETEGWNSLGIQEKIDSFYGKIFWK
jgi:hypothetical protein